MDLTPLSLYTGLSPQKREIFRFFVVGVSLTLGFTVIATGLRLATALRPSLISALSYAVMIGIGYVAQRVITFQSRVKHSTAFPRYVSVELLGLSISVAFSEVAIARFHLDAVLGLGPFGVFIAYGCVGAATAALNYVLLKYWTFYMRKG